MVMGKCDELLLRRWAFVRTRVLLHSGLTGIETGFTNSIGPLTTSECFLHELKVGMALTCCRPDRIGESCMILVSPECGRCVDVHRDRV